MQDARLVYLICLVDRLKPITGCSKSPSSKAASEGFPTLYTFFKGSGRGCPLLRMMILPSLLVFSSGMGAD
jgi:hypothetical protein